MYSVFKKSGNVKISRKRSILVKNCRSYFKFCNDCYMTLEAIYVISLETVYLTWLVLVCFPYYMFYNVMFLVSLYFLVRKNSISRLCYKANKVQVLHGVSGNLKSLVPSFYLCSYIPAFPCVNSDIALRATKTCKKQSYRI